MNNIFKKIYILALVLFLGYTQVGCTSKESPQNISNYNNSVSEAKIHFINTIFKKIYILALVLFLGYTQVGCTSKESPQNISNYNNSVSEAKIHFINTGNSDSILIIKDNKAALIDGGDNDDEKLVVSYLKSQGIKELEYIFATHPHADHIGGLDAVIDNIKVKNLYVSNGDANTKSYRDFILSATDKGLNPSVPLLNSEFKLSNSTFKVLNLYVSNGDANTKSYRDFILSATDKGLNPSVPLLNSEFKLSNSTFKVLSVANSEEPNNNSIVLLYTNGNDKVLLMGDAEAEIEKSINPGDVDLLKVGHHGSHSSTTRAFVEKVTPEYAVILAGNDNKEIEKSINPGDVDLLKVGHHGSHSSTTRAFVEKVTPEYAVILAGNDNKYGHPHVETVELLKEKQIEVHRSDECKDIIFSSSGNGINTNCKAGSYNPGVNSKGNKNNNNKYVSYDTNILSSEDIKDTNKSDSNSEIVYWSKNGKKYHSDPTCSGMKNAISGTISESKRTPCSICY